MVRLILVVKKFNKKFKGIKDKMVKPKKKWIADAIKKPGSLRKTLKVKKGKKIPEKKLKIKKGESKLMKRRKVLAKTLKKIRSSKKNAMSKK